MVRQCRTKGLKLFFCNIIFGTTLSSHFVKYAKKNAIFGTTLSFHFVKYAKKNAAAACISNIRNTNSAIPIRQYHYTNRKSTNIRNTNSAICYNTKLLIYGLNSTNTIQIKLTNMNLIQYHKCHEIHGIS